MARLYLAHFDLKKSVDQAPMAEHRQAGGARTQITAQQYFEVRQEFWARWLVVKGA
jgi:hypothetical protein